MTREELKQKLTEIGVKESFYSFKGGLPSEEFCLNKVGDDWEVYYSERGQKSQHKKFNTESEACEHFLHFITSDSVVMDNLEK